MAFRNPDSPGLSLRRSATTPQQANDEDQAAAQAGKHECIFRKGSEANQEVVTAGRALSGSDDHCYICAVSTKIIAILYGYHNSISVQARG